MQPVRMAHYVVLERLGAGGMGMVYAAFDERLERKVAIKVLRPQRAASAGAQARMLREAQSLARLAHPNVVAIHHVDTLPDGEVFLAMEHIKGVSLRTWQARPGRTWREIVAMYAQAGAGLAAAHRAGIVHRDFKPDNVLVDEDGRARVIDFGLARSGPGDAGSAGEVPASPAGTGAALTATGTVMGTPGYMAPEQAAGQPGDARADQFGFCAALYEAVHGERPFGDLAFFHERAPRSPPPRPPSVQAWLWAVIARGLALAPADRFPSMDALLGELTRERGRSRRLALAAGVVVLVAGVAGAAPSLVGADEPCPVPAGALAGVWDTATRTRVRAALLGTGLPFAGDAWRAIEAVFDGHARDWLGAHQSACRATHVQRAQSGEVLDLRMECLAGRRRAFRGAVDVLQASPARAAAHVDDVLQSLGDIDICKNTRALRLGVRLPRDAAMVRDIERAREHLAAGGALLAAGELARARRRLDVSNQALATLDYEPVQAEALRLRGRLVLAEGRIAEGVDILSQAVRLAIGARHDELAADAWLSLAMEAGPRYTRPADAHEWVAHAEAALHRLDHAHDPRRVVVAHARGRIQVAEGRHRDAVETLARALEMATSAAAGGADRGLEAGLEAGLLHDRANALALLGEAGPARDLYQRALALRLARWGPAHPKVATTRVALGLLLIDYLGQIDAGEAELAKAAQIYRASHGADSLDVGHVELSLSKACMYRGAYVEALAHAERGLAIYDRLLDAGHPRRGEALMAIGVYRFMTRDFEGSLAAYRAALAILEPARGAEHVDVGLLRSNIGETLLALGMTSAAVAELERALDIMRGVWGPDHPELALPLKGLGLAHLAQGQARAARPALERALSLQGAEGGDPQERAEIQWALARALGLLGQERGRGRQLARAALETYRGLGPDWRERVDMISGWLQQ